MEDNEEKQMQGKSVGAIIRDADGKFLTQYRLKEPVGLALPAGHVDDGESPEEALRRELAEETGLVAETLQLALHGTFPTGCGKGHESHEWWVYWVAASGAPELKETDKHKFLRYMSIEEMQPFLAKGEADPAWFKHIFPMLGIL